MSPSRRLRMRVATVLIVGSMACFVSVLLHPARSALLMMVGGMLLVAGALTIPTASPVGRAGGREPVDDPD